MELIAQILSIIGMIGTVLAFQIKKTQHFCIATIFTCTVFAMSYFLLDAPTSGAINLVAAVRGVLAAYPKTRTKLYFYIICVVQIIATALTFTGILSVMVCFAELVGTAAMWFFTEINIRKARIFVQSPLWLINNICVFNIGGAICEVFTIVSSTIFCIRFKKGLNKNQNA